MENRFNVAMLLVIAVFCGMAAAQVTRFVVAEPVPNPGPVYYGHERNVARATDGTLLAAWQDNATNGQIVFAVFDESFQSWGPSSPISSASGEAAKAGLVADAQGAVHAAWQQIAVDAGSQWAIYYSRYSGGAWSTPAQVSQDNTIDAEECALVVDNDGRVMVVWNTDAEADGSEWILSSISTDNGSTWATPDTLSSADGIINGTSTTSGRVSLWAGSSRRVVAIWHEDYPGREREIYLNQFDGTSWQGEVVISDTTAAVTRHWYPNVAMDSNDTIYAFYATDQNGVATRHLLLGKKAWDAGAWPAERDTVTASPDDFLTNAITIDSQNNVYVGWRQGIPADTIGIEEVVYSTSVDGGASWTAPAVLSRPNHDAGYLTFVDRVVGDGVDAAWRESYRESIDDQDSTSVMSAKIPLASTTAVDSRDQGGNLPTVIALNQSYPNPLDLRITPRSQTVIAFSLSRAGSAQLEIYNLLGQTVTTLLDRQMPAGTHRVTWEGRDQSGRLLPGGIYFYRLRSQETSVVRKLVLIR